MSAWCRRGAGHGGRRRDLLRRWGRKVAEARWAYDGSAQGGKKIAYGNTWVIAAIVVKLPFCSRGGAAGVVEAVARQGHACQVELAAEMVKILAGAFPGRAVHGVGDAAFHGKPLVIEGTTWTPGCRPARCWMGRDRRAPASVAGLASGAPGWASPPRSPRTRLAGVTVTCYGASAPCRHPPPPRCGTAASARPPAVSSWSKSPARPGPVTWRSSPSTRQLPLRRSSNDTPGGGRLSRRMRPESRSWASAMPATGCRRGRADRPVRFLVQSLLICWYARYAYDPADVARRRCYARGTSPRPSPASPTCSPGSAASSSPPISAIWPGQTPPGQIPDYAWTVTPSPHNSETEARIGTFFR